MKPSRNFNEIGALLSAKIVLHCLTRYRLEGSKKGQNPHHAIHLATTSAEWALQMCRPGHYKTQHAGYSEAMLPLIIPWS